MSTPEAEVMPKGMTGATMEQAEKDLSKLSLQEQQLMHQRAVSDLGRMLAQLKKQLKPYSKNELIRIISLNLINLQDAKFEIEALKKKYELKPVAVEPTAAIEPEEKT